MVQPAFASGSLPRLLKAQWQILKELRLANFGTTTTILPLIPPEAAINATTHTTWPASSGSSQTATWSTAPSGLATPYTEDLITTRSVWTAPGLYGPAGIPGIKLNGTAERVTVPDAAYWTRATTAFSIIVCVVPVTNGGEADDFLLSKWDATTGAQREWAVGQTNSTNLLNLSLIDESDVANPIVKRETDAAISLNVPLHICVTHDGGTGATAMDNAVIYVNGASVASTATNNAAYAGMDDGTSVVAVGNDSEAVRGWSNLLFGGPYGPTFVQAQLTAAQVLRDYEMWREAMGLGR